MQRKEPVAGGRFMATGFMVCGADKPLIV